MNQDAAMRSDSGYVPGPDSVFHIRGNDDSPQPPAEHPMLDENGEAATGDETVLPTSENYIHDNPTAPPCMKRNAKAALVLEHNIVCRKVGCIGFKRFGAYRGRTLGVAAFFSFVVLSLSIIPLIPSLRSSGAVKTFPLATGTLTWDLIIPSDWTDMTYIGMTGMTNETRKGDLYYNRMESEECYDVYGSEVCNSCNGATATVWALIIVGMVTAGLGFILDIHRMFMFWDMNCSKFTALFLHMIMGIVFAVMPFVVFQQDCLDILPTEITHRSVGITIEWSMGITHTLLLVILILRPIPAIIHILVPTPVWAHTPPMNLSIGTGGPESTGCLGFVESEGSMAADTVERDIEQEGGADTQFSDRAPAPEDSVRYDEQPIEGTVQQEQQASDSYVPYYPQESNDIPLTARSSGSAQMDYGDLMSARPYQEGTDDSGSFQQPSSVQASLQASVPPTMPAGGGSMAAVPQAIERFGSPTGTEPPGTPPPGSPRGMLSDSFVDPFADPAGPLNLQPPVMRGPGSNPSVDPSALDATMKYPQ